MIEQNEMILRLALATILGGLIGLERESRNRPAGLRTHILVSLGSCLLMLVSMYGFEGGDPARLAAQVVSGIGFLGAGTILRDGNNIRGLTTAASLWVSGGIGLAIGNGYYAGAIITGLIVIFSLVSLGFFEKQLFSSSLTTIHITCEERIGLISDIASIVASNCLKIKDIKFKQNDDCDYENPPVTISLTLKIPDNFSTSALVVDLYKINGVKDILLKNKISLEADKNDK